RRRAVLPRGAAHQHADGPAQDGARRDVDDAGLPLLPLVDPHRRQPLRLLHRRRGGRLVGPGVGGQPVVAQTLIPYFWARESAAEKTLLPSASFFGSFWRASRPLSSSS